MNIVRPDICCLPLLLVVSLSLVCTGCWEEIRYDASKAPELPPQADEMAASQDEERETPPPAEQLFAESPPDTKPEPSEQDVAEEADAQPDDPLATALELDEGQSTTTTPAPPADLDWLDDPPTSRPAGIEDLDEPTLRSRTAIAAWRLGSKWSLAAAYFAKGLGTDHYGEPLEQAAYAAELLDLELPALPEKLDGGALQPAVVRYLLEESGPRLVDQLREGFSEDHAALAELAVRTHALLLVYTPLNQKLDPLVSAIRQAAENSSLPESAWRELIDLLEQRAEYATIKQAVFGLHTQAADILSGLASQ